MHPVVKHFFDRFTSRLIYIVENKMHCCFIKANVCLSDLLNFAFMDVDC